MSDRINGVKKGLNKLEFSSNNGFSYWKRYRRFAVTKKIVAVITR